MTQPIELLLGALRAPNLLNWHSVVAGQRIAVTGAGGFIGSHLCETLLAAQPETLLLVENNEYALYQALRRLQAKLVQTKGATRLIPLLMSYGSRRLEKVLKEFKVGTVVHAGAHKHVPLVERNPVSGVQNNVCEYDTLLEACEKHGWSLLVISTDKAVNPTNVMGATKRLVEDLTRTSTLDKYSVVRFGNVMWSSGSVLNVFHEQLSTTRVVTVTHPEVDRFFMTVDQAVGLVLQTLCLGRKGIFALDMGKPVKIVDLVGKLADAMGVSDYEVEYVGLRPGEKLHEEVCLGKNLSKTAHPEIMEAAEPEPGYDRLEMLSSMHRAVLRNDAGQVRQALQKYVEGYAPQCGIVDDFWLEANVKHGLEELSRDDCFEPTRPVR